MTGFTFLYCWTFIRKRYQKEWSKTGIKNGNKKEGLKGNYVPLIINKIIYLNIFQFEYSRK
jgi:hypothetical protein